jgi:hypothetical protein
VTAFGLCISRRREPKRAPDQQDTGDVQQTHQDGCPPSSRPRLPPGVPGAGPPLQQQ